MNKDQIKSLLDEHKTQLHSLAYEDSLLQKKSNEIAAKMQEITGIVAALEYVDKMTVEPVIESPEPSTAAE